MSSMEGVWIFSGIAHCSPRLHLPNHQYQENGARNIYLNFNRAVPENIHNSLWTTLNWVPKTLRISKKDSSSLCRIPNPADSKSWGIPEICKILNGFSGIPVNIHKISRKFMEFQSSSPSIYYRIFNVVHGGVWIFSGTAH